MERRANGRGSIYKVSDGKYMATWRDAGKVHHKRISASSDYQARVELDRLTFSCRAANQEDKIKIKKLEIATEEEKLKAEIVNSKNFPLDGFADKFYGHINCTHYAANSKALIDSSIKIFVDWSKSHGIKMIQDIKKYHIDDFLAYVSKVKSDNSYNLVLRILKKVWKTLSETYYLDDAIFKGYKIRDVKSTPKRNLTPDEMDSLMTYLDDADKETKVFWYLGIYCGMRRIDAKNLRWENVDIEKGIIRYKPQKTIRHDTTATIPMHEKLKQAIMSLDKTGDYLLPTFAALKIDAVKVRISNVFKRLGIKVKDDAGNLVVGFHSLRHSFISRLIDNATPITTVAQMVGHTKTNAYRMTLGYYNGTDDTSLSKTALDKVFSSSGDDKDDKTIVQDDDKAEIERLRKENEDLKSKLKMLKEMLLAG